jgi:crotonobetainyl-CoA:carnitine CoA-transferase CaiB-like acyl-CoA transferase
VPLVDLFTGMYATVSILAALHHRTATGEGQHLDISLMGAVLAISSGQLSNYMVGGTIPGRTGNHAPNITPYGVFPCADGQLIVASANQGQFKAICTALGHPEWAADERFKDNGARIAHRMELYELLAGVMRTQTRAHWEEIFTQVGVPAGPINNYEQALAHPQAQHLKARIGIPHPLGGEAPGIASPMRLSKTPVSYRRPPPMLGEHTRDVLRELGLEDSAIDALAAKGTIRVR